MRFTQYLDSACRHAADGLARVLPWPRRRGLPALVVSTAPLLCSLFAAPAGPGPATPSALDPSASAVNCSVLPPIDASKNFLGNFLTPCYGIPLQNTVNAGLAVHLPTGLDPYATYSQLYYRITPGYQIILYGTFPLARYFSISVYDDHEALVGTVLDANIQPFSSKSVNPFRPGVPWVDDQKYMVAVNFGASLPAKVKPGCGLGTSALNALDATVRHAGMSWNGDVNTPTAWPAHNDGPSQAGYLTVRRYQNQAVASKYSTPVYFVRDLSTGCAVPADQVNNVLQFTTMDSTLGSSWLDGAQSSYHLQYGQNIQPRLCYLTDPANAVGWRRSPEYVPGNNPDAAYVNTQPLSFNPPKTGLLRIRFRLPTMPKIPCAGCSLTGQEELRYWSLSFMSGTKSIAGISDVDLYPDPNGYVTLIVGTSGVPPSFVTPENGYTYVDISQKPGFNTINAIYNRNILPSAAFACDAHQVGYLTTEYNSLGGFMGEYVPTVEWVTPSTLSPTASPYVRPNSCGLVPPELPSVCTLP